MKPHLSYVICSSPRSGSSMLCNGLWSTNIAGRPAEYYNPGILDEMLVGKKLGVTEDNQYVEKMIAASTTDNGVFGMKLHPFQAPFLLMKISERRGGSQKSLRESMEREFTNLRYIYLNREDKIAQAVSYYRALRTSEWWRYEGKPVATLKEDAYYELGIRKLLNHVKASDRYWEGFFDKHRLSPLRLTFDEVTKDYENTVRRTLEYLGLDSSVPIAQPNTQKISDGITREWERRFRESNDKKAHKTVVPRFWAPY